MYKLTVVYPAPSDPAKFRDYYLNSHLPLAHTIPGLRRTSYSFDLQGMGPQEPPFCVFEAWFDDAEAMSAALSSPEGQRTGADVVNYTDAPPAMYHGPVIEG